MKGVTQSGGKEEDESPCKNMELSDPSIDLKFFDTRIFTIPLITDLVFADFLYSDLLKCSLVSKAWNLTCRGVLLDRFRTYLTLTEKSNFQSLEDFYNLIRDGIPGHQHPVNGIWIKFEARVRKWPFSSEFYVNLISRIMGRMQIKCVRFDMANLQLQATDFYQILKALVIPYLGTIEFLEIMHFGGNPEMLAKWLKVDSLPILKELNFGNTLNRLKCSSFKRILRACPNLKTIPGVLPHQLPILKYTKNLHLASNIRFNYMRLTSIDFQLLEEYSALIKNLDVQQNYKQGQNQYKGDFIYLLLPLLTSHLQPNLKSLDIDLELLIAILEHPMPPLLNVKELYCRGGQRWFPCLFKNSAVPFAQVLPNLKSATFSWRPKYSKWLNIKCHSEDYGDEDGLLPVLLCQIPASLLSVTTLRLYCSGLSCFGPYETLTKIMDLDKVFPCITYLDIRMDLSGLEDFLKWICESWGDVLETLILQGTKCLGLQPESQPEELLDVLADFKGIKRKELPPGTKYSDKLYRLRRLELEFRHVEEWDVAGNYGKNKVKVQNTFEPRTGQKVQLIISGCRAKKRIKSVRSGVSIYDMILALHSCPRNLELSLMEEIISNKSICRTISKMLPTADLRHCRRVNRCWNAVAREVFYERASFTLTLDPSRLSAYFNEPRITSNNFLWFAEGNQKLFNCLKIICGSYYYYRENGYLHLSVGEFVDLLKSFDFTQTCFKVLEVQFNFSYDDPDHHQSHAYKICKALFEKLSVHRVQKLITPIEHFDKLFLDKDGNVLFPNLQSIEFLDPEKILEYHQVFRKLLKDLNCLERIEVPFNNKLLPFVSAVGKTHCVKQVQLFKSVFYHDNEELRTALMDHIIRFVENHEPRIECVSIGNDVSLCGKDFQKLELVLRRLFQSLCTSSSKSLQTLNLNLPFLHFVFGLKARPLVALKTIEMLFNEVEFDPQGLLAQIPFFAMAPNLEELKITRDIDPSLDSVLGTRSTPDCLELTPIQPFSSVKSMEYKIESIACSDFGGVVPWSSELWTMQYLSRVFPNITKFTFSCPGSERPGAGNGFTTILSLIWTSWPGLEILEVDVNDMDAVSFETSILGISKEEWRIWYEQLENTYIPDPFNNMHYASSSASIRNCKGLKEFRSKRSIESRLVKWYGNYSWRNLCLGRSFSK